MATQYAAAARRLAWEKEAKARDQQLEAESIAQAERDSKRKFATNLITSIGGALVGKAGILPTGFNLIKGAHDIHRDDQRFANEQEDRKEGKVRSINVYRNR